MAGAITYPITDDHPAIDIACRNGAEVRAAHDIGDLLGWTQMDLPIAGGSGLKSSTATKTATQQGHHKRGDVIFLRNTTWSTGTPPFRHGARQQVAAIPCVCPTLTGSSAPFTNPAQPARRH